MQTKRLLLPGKITQFLRIKARKAIMQKGYRNSSNYITNFLNSVIPKRNMNLIAAAKATLKSKRFWLWQISGAIIYAIPVAIRFITKSAYIPILSFGFWIGHYIPGNLVEKVLVNAFFPGGAGGVAGELLSSNYKGEAVKGKTKYLSRLGGAWLQTAVWSAFQFWGNSLQILGPWSIGEGWGNIFEYWTVFPLNFALAAFSIFTPDVVNFLKAILAKAYRKLSGRKSKG